MQPRRRERRANPNSRIGHYFQSAPCIGTTTERSGLSARQAASCLVPDSARTLLAMLQRRSPTTSSRKSALGEACEDLGLGEDEATSPISIGYALLKMGVQSEEVSRLLTWREFERLSAAVLRASGYSVSENVVLTKPRAQLDIVAAGASILLSVDCKHYRRGNSPSALARFARDQLRRSSLYRAKVGDPRPIASMILSMSDPEGGFVEGVAVVPIRTLRNFLTTLESYTGLMDLR